MNVGNCWSVEHYGFFLDLFIYVDLSKPKKKTFSFDILNLLSGIIL